MMGLEWSPCPAAKSDGVLNFILISVVTFSFTLKGSVTLHIPKPEVFLGISLIWLFQSFLFDRRTFHM